VGEREDARIRGLLREAVAPHAGEEVEELWWCKRELAFEDSWRKGPRALRRLFGRGDHPADRLGALNVLCVTPTRVVVVAGREKPPFVAARGVAGAWPRAEVTATTRSGTAVAESDGGSQSWSTRITRAQLHVPGCEEPLVLDFRREPGSRAVLALLKRPPA
jgi:hypothetical protein